MALNEKIYIGAVDTPTLEFNASQIESISCNNSVDLIGNELSSDSMEISVFYDDTNGTLRSVEYGTPIFYYSNDSLVGKYYVLQINRVDVKKYTIQATSMIGLISKEDFYGGFYSGKTLETVIDEILFTNGISSDLYSIYAPVSTLNVGTSGCQVVFDEPTADGWKYHLHVEFTASGGTVNSVSYVAGGGSYQVLLYIHQTNEGPYFDIRVNYSSVWFSDGQLNDERIGYGSSIIVDVNPLTGTGSIVANYINPNDPTDTGTLSTTWTFNVKSSSEVVPMRLAYGCDTTSSYPNYYNNGIKWDAYQVYDENGDLIIDAAFATKGNKKYVANKANGYVVETQSFNPTGPLLDEVISFTDMDRNRELKENIVYSAGIASIPIYGWIGIGTKRDALHQLLFAENVALIKSEDGKIMFTQIVESEPEEIADADIYDDSGEQSSDVAKKISVSQHSFETTGVSSEKIFDNTNSELIEGEYIAVFDKAPIFGTPVGSGITIKEYNCNVAVVTGRGTITGTPYNHSQHAIVYQNGSLKNGSEISVSDVGVITSLNADNVMNKLKAYYSKNVKKITNSLKYNGERCGIRYSFKTKFSNENIAFLSECIAKVSSFVRATCTFISGYVPPNVGGYSNYAICVYNDTWVVPQSVKDKTYPSIRLNIIGKGQNGTNGANGADGNSSRTGTGSLQSGAGGAGGAGGVGGTGGKIYAVTVDVTNVAKVVISQSGNNTLAKTYDSNNTLLNTYSSASGNSSDTGFLNILDGKVYARKGKDGVKGGDGGDGGYITFEEQEDPNWGQYWIMHVTNPENGEDVDVYVGGHGDTYEERVEDAGHGWENIYYSNYGGGGGAAYGSNGGNSESYGENNYWVFTDAGDGGNAIAPDPYTEYGSGGCGGHGGGGGGGAGTRVRFYYEEMHYDDPKFETLSQAVGTGGTGSAGTSGKNGCVIIYY